MPISTAIRTLDINEMLPLLASIYGMGRLVPFIGAGMSRRKFADWQGFIDNLGIAAGSWRGRGPNRREGSKDFGDD